MKMKKTALLLMLLLSVACFTSCKGSSAQKAIKIVKEFGGKVINSGEKAKIVGQYGDDVIRHLDFQKVRCTECGGDGITWNGYKCNTCSGNGYVYKIKSK